MPNIVEIRDLPDPAVAVYARLTEAQLMSRVNPAEALFIAESPNVIAAALDAGCVPVSLLMERRHIAGKAADIVVRCGDVPVYTADAAVLRALTGYPLTRGVLCALKRPTPRTAAQVCAGARRVAVLEDIVDTTNVGAIFRSAAALGVDALLITPACCDPLNRRALRVSMGTVLKLPWARLDAWPEGLSQLTGLGFTTAALALREDAIPIDDPRLAAAERLALLLGTEGDGLTDAAIAGCDLVARIPMARGVDSLNVAAASAVAFWECRRRDAHPPAGAATHP